MKTQATNTTQTMVVNDYEIPKWVKFVVIGIAVALCILLVFTGNALRKTITKRNNIQTNIENAKLLAESKPAKDETEKKSVSVASDDVPDWLSTIEQNAEAICEIQNKAAVIPAIDLFGDYDEELGKAPNVIAEAMKQYSTYDKTSAVWYSSIVPYTWHYYITNIKQETGVVTVRFAAVSDNSEILSIVTTTFNTLGMIDSVEVSNTPDGAKYMQYDGYEEDYENGTVKYPNDATSESESETESDTEMNDFVNNVLEKAGVSESTERDRELDNEE